MVLVCDEPFMWSSCHGHVWLFLHRNSNPAKCEFSAMWEQSGSVYGAHNWFVVITSKFGHHRSETKLPLSMWGHASAVSLQVGQAQSHALAIVFTTRAIQLKPSHVIVLTAKCIHIVTYPSHYTLTCEGLSIPSMKVYTYFHFQMSLIPPSPWEIKCVVLFLQCLKKSASSSPWKQSGHIKHSCWMLENGEHGFPLPCQSSSLACPGESRGKNSLLRKILPSLSSAWRGQNSTQTLWVPGAAFWTPPPHCITPKSLNSFVFLPQYLSVFLRQSCQFILATTVPSHKASMAHCFRFLKSNSQLLLLNSVSSKSRQEEVDTD